MKNWQIEFNQNWKLLLFKRKHPFSFKENWKDTDWEKYLQILYEIKDLYPEYVNMSQTH